MVGAGTVINPIIKIVTAVLVLGASYLFIVKPILDTTDKAINSAGVSIENARAQSEESFRNAQIDAARSRINSFEQSLQGTWPAAAREVRACAQDAGDDLAELKGCDSFGEKLRSFPTGLIRRWAMFTQRLSSCRSSPALSTQARTSRAAAGQPLRRLSA